MQKVKDYYIDLYKQYHNKVDRYPGNSFANGYSEITKLIVETNSKTVLDYGCGKALQYTRHKLHEKWNIGMPTLYDPAVSGLDKLPDGPFDGIYSTDVMEHIPEEIIPSVFEWIFSKANKFVFLGICTRPAVAILPNGENAHCTVQTIDWWKDMIIKHSPKPVYTHLKCYGNSNGYEILNKS